MITSIKQYKIDVVFVIRLFSSSAILLGEASRQGRNVLRTKHLGVKRLNALFLLLARYVSNVAKKYKCNIEDRPTDRPTDLCSWKSLPGRISNGHISITVLE